MPVGKQHPWLSFLAAERNSDNFKTSRLYRWNSHHPRCCLWSGAEVAILALRAFAAVAGWAVADILQSVFVQFGVIVDSCCTDRICGHYISTNLWPIKTCPKTRLFPKVQTLFKRSQQPWNLTEWRIDPKKHPKLALNQENQGSKSSPSLRK